MSNCAQILFRLLRYATTSIFDFWCSRTSAEKADGADRKNADRVDGPASALLGDSRFCISMLSTDLRHHMIGTKLAHYEITGHLGSGSMGEVYQATDTTLGRSVAIKILPEAFAHDADRLARFKREARVLASLNHPNIAAIYGLEQSAIQHFLVMELVGGETLAERIKRGRIPVDESLGFAKQIAEALEAAHENGVIHRDLKPANIKVTSDGQVKILDFGLAKAFASEPSSAHLSDSPTLSMAATNVGVILGTAAYMSPEQAKGRTVDRRCDIFSFGCVVYEMLTGYPAFPGDDVTEILGRVVTAEPDWSRLPAGIPAAIPRMLRRALKKDPRQRLGDIRDARIEIDEAGTEVEKPVARVSARGVRLAWILASAGVLVSGVLAIPAVRYLREAPPPSLPETRLDVVTSDTTDPVSFALSPDGLQIAFVASGDGASRLWLRSLDSTTAQPLAGTEGAAYPFWSPDGHSLGFATDDKLKLVDTGGAAPRTLSTVSASRGGGSMNAAGVILFTPAQRSSLFRVLASGGEAVAVTKRDGQSSHRFPYFLPDDRHFLFHSDGPPETGGIYLGSLDSTETRRLTPSNTAGVYLSSGWLLWVRAGALVAQRLDLERKVLTGSPVTLADSVANAVSVSASGLVAYRASGNNRRQLAWFDRSGKPLGTIGSPDENGPNIPSLSSDGSQAAVQRRLQGNVDIWLLDGTRSSQFTFDPALDRNPILSPDGTIVFNSNRRGHIDLYQTSGPGREELLWESAQDKFPSDWSRDGRFILYHSFDAQTVRDLWVLPMYGDRHPCEFLKTNFDERWASFSPDGHWVAYMSNESGTNEIYVRPFAQQSPCPSTPSHAGARWRVSSAGGIHPRWRPDSKELYYIAFPNAQMMAVRITPTGTTLDHGTPVPLFPTRIPGSAENIREYDVSRDGRFLINTILNEASSPITILQNWKPPVK